MKRSLTLFKEEAETFVSLFWQIMLLKRCHTFQITNKLFYFIPVYSTLLLYSFIPFLSSKCVFIFDSALQMHVCVLWIRFRNENRIRILCKRNRDKSGASKCLLAIHLQRHTLCFWEGNIQSGHFLLLALLASLIFTEMLWPDNPQLNLS